MKWGIESVSALMILLFLFFVRYVFSFYRIILSPKAAKSMI